MGAHVAYKLPPVGLAGKLNGQILQIRNCLFAKRTHHYEFFHKILNLFWRITK